jgi:hypothetical protein
MLGYNYQSNVGFSAGYDDVRLYNGVVLTSSQITILYGLKSNNNPIPNPTNYYLFDKDALDYASGSGINDAIITGTLSYSSSNYKVGSGAVFTAPTSYISLPPLKFSDNGFSISMWYYYMGTSGARVFEFSNTYNDAFFIYMSSNQAIYQDRWGSNFNVGTPMQINTWYHFAIVLSPNNTVQSYFNGVASASGSSTYVGGLTSITRSNNMLGYNYQSNVGFSAGYDDVRLCNGVVLTSSQITTIYNLK